MEKKNNEVEMYRIEHTTSNEEVYEIAKFDDGVDFRLYIRKYGERRGENFYFGDEDELEELLISALIDNRQLRLKLRDAKRALR